jgi:hypothetical protein
MHFCSRIKKYISDYVSERWMGGGYASEPAEDKIKKVPVMLVSTTIILPYSRRSV